MSQANSGNITQFTPAAGTAIAQAIKKTRALPADRRATPNSFNTVSASMPILYGTLTAAWTPGTNSVTLTPCKGPTDNTATGAANVVVTVQFPVGTSPPAQYLGVAVGAILPYLPLPAGGDTAGFLLNPPLPQMNDQFQTWSNNSSDTANPNVIADWVRAH